MTHFFDGKGVAKELTIKLRKESKKLKKPPKLVSILVGDDPSSELYLRLKKEAAERVGMEVEIINFQKKGSVNQLIKLIKNCSEDKYIHGIMVQLPLPKSFSKKDRDKIVDSIVLQKDVDGMRDESPYVAPVVQAVVTALAEALRGLPLKTASLKVVVVGHNGFEGSKILKKLQVQDRDLKWKFLVEGVDVRTRNSKLKTRNADILVSATGVPNLIRPDMVKQGVVLIDVGSPKGDIDKAAYKKALFVSPVPGGIGPLTVIYLLKNLVESGKKV